MKLELYWSVSGKERKLAETSFMELNGKSEMSYRKYAVIIVVLAVVSAGCRKRSQSPDAELEKLGKAVLASLKKNDVDAFLRLTTGNNRLLHEASGSRSSPAEGDKSFTRPLR